MPTVLLVDGFRFFFFANEGNEPAHIHVERAECQAKFWLDPVNTVWFRGFRSSEISALLKLVREHQAGLLSAWLAVHPPKKEKEEQK